jgi:hypothetical protein
VPSPYVAVTPSLAHFAEGLGAHLPSPQTKPVAHSASAAHEVRHLLVTVSQVKLPAHGAGARQAPVASQTDSFPAVHPSPHVCPALGYAHDARLTPSHCPAQAVPVPAHAARGLRGFPFTAMQVPALPGSAHA